MNRLEHSAVLPMDEYEKMSKSHIRYGFVRSMSPNDFAMMWDKNIKTGIPFDRLVDEAIADRVETLAANWKAEQKKYKPEPRF